MFTLLATTFALLAAETNHYELSLAGGTIMACSIGAVLLLVGFCLYRVLTLTPPETEELKGPLAIDTLDTQDAD
jgi:hypothetical protein